VAVFPGDVLVGDGDGVIVLPREIAAEVAADAMEQERQERFVLYLIQAGSTIVGVYPMNEATAAAYREWREGEQSE